MTTRAHATFELKSFQEETVVEPGDGSKLTRATITRAPSGDIVGEAVWVAVMFYLPDTTATIRGLERVTGRILDREGGFILTTEGTFDGTVMRSSTAVVAGSATGALEGLTGQGATEAPHGPTGSFDLEYDVPQAAEG